MEAPTDRPRHSAPAINSILHISQHVSTPANLQARRIVAPTDQPQHSARPFHFIPKTTDPYLPTRNQNSDRRRLPLTNRDTPLGSSTLSPTRQSRKQVSAQAKLKFRRRTEAITGAPGQSENPNHLTVELTNKYLRTLFQAPVDGRPASPAK
jgi:hypothetical protein